MAIKISTINKLDIAIMELRGLITSYSQIQQIKSCAADLIEQGNRKLIVDLGNVTLLNSIGIGSLIDVYTMYFQNEGQIKLCRMNRTIQNLFVITKLIMVFEVEETRDEAIRGTWGKMKPVCAG